jgi:Domain of unknown function (DUF6916)
MGGPRLEDFSGGLGKTWEVEREEGAVPLRLGRAQALPRAMREEGGFRLEWTGPADRPLEQATYRFSRDGAVCEMFIVPVARNGDALVYEAIFS